MFVKMKTPALRWLYSFLDPTILSCNSTAILKDTWDIKTISFWEDVITFLVFSNLFEPSWYTLNSHKTFVKSVPTKSAQQHPHSTRISLRKETILITFVCFTGCQKVPQWYVLHILNIFQLSREGELTHEGEEQKQILWPVGPPLSACSCQRFAAPHGWVCNANMCQHTFCTSDDKLQFAGEPLRLNSSVDIKAAPALKGATRLKNKWGQKKSEFSLLGSA